MTLLEFKKQIITYAQSCLPAETKPYLKIPDSSRSGWIYIKNKDDLYKFVKSTFDTGTLTTQVAWNNDIDGLINLDSFPKSKDLSNLYGKEILEIFPNKDENEFLEEEKRKIRNNIRLALVHPKTAMYKLLASLNVSLEKNGESLKEEPIKMNEEKMNMPAINQILYGPPGTGKTFNTINEALEICGVTTAALNRHEIKAKFEKLVNQGRIIFATFHQSMSYEDFVEGIKPVEPDKDGDPVIYRIEDGIFKRLCIEAAFALANKNESTTERVLDFSAAFDNLVGFLEERLVSEEEVTLTTKNGGKVLVDGISAKGSIIIKHPGKDNTYPISKERLSKLDQAFPDLSVVNNIDQQFRKIIGGSNSTANWSVLNAIRERNSQGQQINQTDNQYTWEDKVQVVRSMKNEDFNENTGEPYILIIDEINRGNVSQIFGELITLIEEDKRLGNSEAIRVQLPYSKDWFGVPPNLHIIGTMNTADRSVEALDTAMRRRFSFTEIPPNPALIKTEGKAENGLINGVDLSLLLMTINKRIEKLLDKDHMIGHSYFLNVVDLPALKSVFHNKIIPLLQEYFFGDYGKIGLIIGTDFFEAIDSVNEDFFAPFPDYDSSSLLDRTVYHLKNVMKMNDDHFLKALNVMLGKTTN